MAIRPGVLFHGLTLDLSDQFGPDFVANASKFGPLWPGMSRREAAASSLLNAFLKKLETGRTEDTDKAALAKFLHCNQACEEWQLPSQYDSKTETLIGELRRAVDEFWFKDGFALWDHPFALLAKAKLGPGVNLDSRGESFYAKLFSSPLSCSTEGLYNWYSRYIQRFPSWAEAELNRLTAFGGPSVRPSNRLSFVPKNDEISRCICIEPTLNTFFQLGAADILNDRLFERFGISLDNQQFKNRHLAYLGSMNDDLSTLDLSSASDSISLKMLKWLLPDSFYKRLVALRCESTEIKGYGTVTLNMVSTMGNGYTFPLQTMLFACAVVAAMRFRDLPINPHSPDKPWGVNGDDIICPRIVTGDVILLLNLLGFRLNDDKSFSEGPFRESCGSDYFEGLNVRGVYVKSLSSPGSRYAVLNQLIKFSVRTYIELPRTLKMLFNSVKYYPVPRWANPDSGVLVPFSLARPHLTKDRDIQGVSYRSLESVSSYYVVGEDKIKVPRRRKLLIYNPNGLLISFLQRSIYSSKMGVREVTPRYRTKRRATSCWDSFPSDSNPFLDRDHCDHGLDWRRWESVVSDVIEK